MALINFVQTFQTWTKKSIKARSGWIFWERVNAANAELITTLQAQAHEARKVSREFHEQIQKHHAAGKKALDEMAALVKKGKKLTDDDLKILQSSANLCATLVRDIKQAVKGFSATLVQYHDDEAWSDRPRMYREWITHEINPVLTRIMKERKEDIELGKKVDSLRKRLEQYAARAPEMVKAAQQAVTKQSIIAGGETESRKYNEQMESIKTFLASTTQLSTDYEKFIGVAAKLLSQIADADPKQKLDAKILKAADGQVATGKTAAKNARGVHKTFSIKVDTYKKLVAKFDNRVKKMAAMRVAVAEKELAAMTKQVATLAKIEAEAEKTLTALKKVK
jgi:hypothetical protein